MGFIYCIKNTVNGREYIGQTRAKKVEQRWSQHRRNPHGVLRYAFARWGLKNFTFSVLMEIPDEELNDREVLEIKNRNTLVPNGYNIREGGEACPCHPHTRLKLSEAAKIRFAGRIKKVVTPEQILRYRKTSYARNREIVKARQREYNAKNRAVVRARDRERRRNRTPEQKRAISKKMKEWRRNNHRPYRPLTAEQRKRYREARKESFARYEAKRKKKRQNRTPEQIEQDNQARKEKRTPEKEEARRQRRKELEASRTPEEREERNREYREGMTEEQKDKRRAQARERWANRTPEQIEKEQERGRRRYEELKNKKLQNNKDDGSLQGNSSGDSLSGVAVDQNTRGGGPSAEAREGQTGP